MSSNYSFRKRYLNQNLLETGSFKKTATRPKCLVTIADLPEYWCQNLCDSNDNFIFDIQHHANVAKILSKTNFRVSDRNFLCQQACKMPINDPFWLYLIADDGEECYLYENE